jgi:N-acetylmuramoyl-L-alanine amidase
MKLLLALLVGAGALVSGPASQGAPAAAVRHTQIAGRDYMRLTDWAAANGFTVRWLEAGHRALFTGRQAHFAVSANSAVLQFNGVNVWLSFPAGFKDGSLCLSDLDFRTTLQPLTSSRNPPAGRAVKTIAIDPGHGGRDTGNRVGREDEKKYTLLLAQEMRAQLTAAGFTVKLTRSSDKTVEVRDRAAIVNRTGADLFVCLHFNASPVARSEVRGTEVYCLTPVGASSTNARGVGGDSGGAAGNRNNSRNIELAYQVQKALTRQLGTADRGARRARFAVLRDVTVPAVLIEAGFMSHPVEGRRIFDPAYRRQMARAIVNGIQAYKHAVEP